MVPLTFKWISFFSAQPLGPKKGLKVLKNALGLFLRSADFLPQKDLIAILLCLVASFLAMHRNSQFSAVLFFRYLLLALRLALIAFFQLYKGRLFHAHAFSLQAPLHPKCHSSKHSTRELGRPRRQIIAKRTRGLRTKVDCIVQD